MKLVMHIFATTGVALSILSAISILTSTRIIFHTVVMQVLAANILIHIGLCVVSKFESQFFFLESLVDIGYIIGVLILFGWIFGWFWLAPVWVLTLMAVIIYMGGTIWRMGRLRDDINEINEMLKMRHKDEK